MIGPEIFAPTIAQYFPEPHASLMMGIIFGVDLDTSDIFYEQIRRTGLLHIVVLSGINITLLGAVVGNVTSRFGKKTSAWITIISIIAFVLFVGADPPIVRAGIMGGISLLSVIYERKNIGFYALLLSACVVIIAKREWIESISFQLSYGATLGIMIFGSVSHKTTLGDSKKKSSRGIILTINNFVWAELKPSLASQVFTMPIIYVYFQQISLISPISNILTAPIITPLMVFGMLTAFLGKIHYYIGIVPAFVSFGLLDYVIRVIQFLDSIPHIFIDASIK